MGSRIALGSSIALLAFLPLHAANFALEFDGSRKGAQLGNPMAGAGTDFTWEAWVKPGAPPFGSDGSGIFIHRAHYHDKLLLMRSTRSGSCEVEFAIIEDVDGGGAGVWHSVVTVTFTPGDWIHVAVSYDGSDIRIFIDGAMKLLDHVPQYNGHMTWIEDYFGTYIGTNLREDQPPYFRGVIDEVRAWSVARSEAEIAASMNRRIRGSEANLLGAWSFDDGEGQEIADLSGPSHAGWLGTSPAGPDAFDPLWVRSDSPLDYVEIHEVAPSPAPTGGARVTVTGVRFLSGAETAVTLDGVPVVPVSLESDVLVFDAPPHPDGDVPLEISNSEGRAAVSFTYRSEFMRGDTNGDARIDLGDAVGILHYLFSGGVTNCLDVVDANDDGGVDVSDPVSLLGYLFLGTNRPPEPFISRGVDPTEDSLRCGR